MTTLFIFAEQLNEVGCGCLSISDNGQIIIDFAHRSFDEIQQLQLDSDQTTVVIPTSQASLHRVELPWLGEKKARSALPYALEDQLAQSVESLHVAFDHQHYNQGHYLVVVCDKTYLNQLIVTLKQHQLSFDQITIDWFALDNNQCCLMPNYILVNYDTFRGAVGSELIDIFLSQITPIDQIFRFTDSFNYSEKSLVTIDTQEQSSVWIGKRLQQAASINLCQGEFVNGSKSSNRSWLIAAGAMIALWLVSVIVGNSLQLHRINQQINSLDQQIAVIYHQFFPQAQQVISPRFRIGQLLKSNQGSSDQTFWLLLNNLAQANKAGSHIERLNFQSNMLQVTLVSSDFAELETLQTWLSQHHIKVKQTQASTRDGQVTSTLELSL